MAFCANLWSTLIVAALALGVAPDAHAYDCRAAERLTVHFYDVAQAAAALIEFPDGQAVLVDAGGYRTALAPKLERDLGSRPFAVVWITHPHDDHINQVKAILKHFTVNAYVDNGFDGGARSAKGGSEGLGVRMRAAAESAGAIVLSPQTGAGIPSMTFGAATMTPVKPTEWNPACAHGEANNCSLGVRIDYCESSILFLGDAEVAEEQVLPVGPATLLVVPHHGSRTSSSQALLDRVHPRYAVISAGPESKYCHPDAATVERLSRVLGGDRSSTVAADATTEPGCQWKQVPRSSHLWVTAADGDIVLTTRGDGTFTRVLEPAPAN